MENDLAMKIKNHLLTSQRRELPFPPATADDIAQAERQLGFLLPNILKSVYQEVGNGGFGPGEGARIIGVGGGDAYFLGTLVETYREMQRGAEWANEKWPDVSAPPRKCHELAGLKMR
jgi:hypothetical protein